MVARSIFTTIADDAIGKAVKAFETMMTIQLQDRHDERLPDCWSNRDERKLGMDVDTSTVAR